MSQQKASAMRLASPWLLVLASCISTSPRVVHRVQGTPTVASLRGVSAVSANVCWASGSGGTFLRTIDGGKHWASAVVPGAEHLDFRDIEATDANTAMVMSAGRPAEIWRTEDGGDTWTRKAYLDEEGVFLDSMAFQGDVGLAWGDPLGGNFLTLSTVDSGRSWVRIGTQLPPPQDGEAGFAASGTCIAISNGHAWVGTGGGAARVLRSGDGGETWQAAGTPMQAGMPSKGIFSVAFLDESRGVVVGGDYSRPELTGGTAAYTRDGGATWTSSVGSSGYRSCVAIVPIGSPRRLLSISKVGASVSLDAGSTWSDLALPGHYALDFSPSPWLDGRGVGWAVGAAGSIMRLELWP